MRPAGAGATAAAVVLALTACSSAALSAEELGAAPRCDPMTDADKDVWHASSGPR